MVKLTAYSQDTSTPTALDLGQFEYIKLTKSLFDATDISSRSSDYSHTFRIPMSNNNNTFFAHAYDLNNNGSFNIYNKVRCTVDDNGEVLLDGYLALVSIYQNAKEYEVRVFTEIGNISSSIGDKLLTDLDLSDYNHYLTYGNITNSWNGNITYLDATTGDEVLYPLVDWGFNYGTTSYLGESGVGVQVEQLRPSFKLVTVLNKILAEAGYTANWNFATPADFNNQYLLCGVDSGAVPNFDSSCKVATSSDQNKFTPTALIFANEISDINNVFITDTFTAFADGNYTFILKPIITNSSGTSYTYQFDWDVNGSTVATDTALLGPGVATPTYTQTIALTRGDTLQINYDDNSPAAELTVNTNTTLECTAFPESSYSSVVQMANFMPKVKQLDLLKTVINNYNLIVEVNELDVTVLEITPYQVWKDNGTDRDWTSKLDLSKELITKPLTDLRKQRLLFAHAEDNDVLNEAYTISYGKTFGTYEATISSDLNTEGNQSNFTICSPFTTTTAAGYTDVFLHKAFTLNNDGTLKNEKYKPKIFYYNGTETCSTIYIYNPDASTVNSRTTYPLCSEYIIASGSQVTSTDKVLNWDAYTPFASTHQVNSLPAKNTLYELFWRDYIDQIYANEARGVEAYFYLKPSDLRDFKFNDYVLVGNTWFRVLKINDYTVGVSNSVKVELLKIITKD